MTEHTFTAIFIISHFTEIYSQNERGIYLRDLGYLNLCDNSLPFPNFI
jgi:hypothetical protein